jgi:hypothetical protein
MAYIIPITNVAINERTGISLLPEKKPKIEGSSIPLYLL